MRQVAEHIEEAMQIVTNAKTELILGFDSNKPNVSIRNHLRDALSALGQARKEAGRLIG